MVGRGGGESSGVSRRGGGQNSTGIDVKVKAKVKTYMYCELNVCFFALMICLWPNFRLVNCDSSENNYYSHRRIIHRVFQTRKSRGGQSAIGWQAAAPACQPIADRPPRDFGI